MTTIPHLTDGEVLAILPADTPLARARRVFYSEMAKIEQAEAQRTPPTVFELRRMEIEATKRILVAAASTSEEHESGIEAAAHALFVCSETGNESASEHRRVENYWQHVIEAEHVCPAPTSCLACLREEFFESARSSVTAYLSAIGGQHG